MGLLDLKVIIQTKTHKGCEIVFSIDGQGNCVGAIINRPFAEVALITQGRSDQHSPTFNYPVRTESSYDHILAQCDQCHCQVYPLVSGPNRVMGNTPAGTKVTADN